MWRTVSPPWLIRFLIHPFPQQPQGRRSAAYLSAHRGLNVHGLHSTVSHGWSPSFVPKLHIPHSHSLKVRSHTLTSRLKVYECMLYLLLPLAGSLPAHSRCSRPLLSPCMLVSSRGSGWHSTGDSAIQQKYGWKYAALWTCPEGSVFPAVFLLYSTVACTVPPTSS